MTGAIINPIWFYLMDVLSTIEIASIVVAFSSGIAILAFCIDYFEIADGHDGSAQLERFARKLAKCLVCVFVISLLLILLIPSKETMIEMMIAKYATYENASNAVDAIKNSADYIVDAVLKIKEG